MAARGDDGQNGVQGPGATRRRERNEDVVEFGVLYDMRNPASSGIHRSDLYAETLDHIEAVEGMGFDTVWLTEHHFIDDEYLPSVLPMAAAVAVRTKR